MQHVAILGAGAIGGYLGATWAPALTQARISLTLVGRGATLQALAKLPGIPPLTDDPATLRAADLIVVTTKSTALPALIDTLRAYANPSAPVLSLMNGLSPAAELAAALPEKTVLGGMVPFNVAWSDAGLHRSSAGAVTVQDHPATRALARAVAATEAPLSLVDDPAPIQRGKLLLNLINPINALVGGPLYDVLANRDGRRVFAAAVAEGLATYDALHLPWQKVGPFSPRLAAQLLTLPDWLFNRTILPIQRVDRHTQTSMAQDVAAGRRTEIDALNGEIVRLAGQAGHPAPVNSALVALISGGHGSRTKVDAKELREMVGL